MIVDSDGCLSKDDIFKKIKLIAYPILNICWFLYYLIVSYAPCPKSFFLRMGFSFPFTPSFPIGGKMNLCTKTNYKV